jgi:hypothetical protein
MGIRVDGVLDRRRQFSFCKIPRDLRGHRDWHPASPKAFAYAGSKSYRLAGRYRNDVKSTRQASSIQLSCGSAH